MERFIMLFACLVLVCSCSFTRARIDYKKHNLYSSDNAGNYEYSEIEPIGASAKGFVWDNCNQIILNIVEEMVTEAKAKRGNALINVKWQKGNSLVTTPYCKTAWGWFALYILPGLGPWMKSAEATGTIVKLGNKKANLINGILLSKEKSSLEIAKKYIERQNF